MLRIGLCAPYDLARDGGVNSHIRAQAAALARLGHRVTIFGAASAPLSNGERRMSGCISPVIGGTETGMGIDPRAWARVGALFASERFDVVHVHEPLMPIVAWCAVLRARVPVVGTFHTHRERGHRFYARYGPLLQPLMRRLDVRLAVSPSARRTMARYFPGDYDLVPNGIDAGRFRGPAPRPADMDPARPHVLYVGRLEPRKGVVHLIEAMARVQREQAARLIIVGDGPEREACAARARERGVDARFVGRVADEHLPAYYQAADVVCSPATGDESFGIVLLEAMAAGRAVVATDIEGYRELVGDDPERASLVPPRDPGALAHALAALLGDREARARLAAGGPDFAARFDWMALARDLEARYVAQVALAARRTAAIP